MRDCVQVEELKAVCTKASALKMPPKLKEQLKALTPVDARGRLQAPAPELPFHAEAMEAGIVWVQCSQPCFCQAPWGGVKRSGIGRELGTFGIDGFLEPKQVTTYVSKNPLGWYTLPKSRL